MKSDEISIKLLQPPHVLLPITAFNPQDRANPRPRGERRLMSGASMPKKTSGASTPKGGRLAELVELTPQPRRSSFLVWSGVCACRAGASVSVRIVSGEGRGKEVNSGSAGSPRRFSAPARWMATEKIAWIEYVVPRTLGFHTTFARFMQLQFTVR